MINADAATARVSGTCSQALTTTSGTATHTSATGAAQWARTLPSRSTGNGVHVKPATAAPSPNPTPSGHVSSPPPAAGDAPPRLAVASFAAAPPGPTVASFAAALPGRAVASCGAALPGRAVASCGAAPPGPAMASSAAAPPGPAVTAAGGA